MCEEIWMPVKGYEGLYEVSSFGRVRSLDAMVRSKHGFRLKNSKIRKPSLKPNGYLQIGLSKNEKVHNFYVHRLVAFAFLDLGDLVVDHINGDRSDNVVWNLDVVTQRENICRGVTKRGGELSVGVSLRKDGKFLSFFRENGKQYYLGFFETPSEAEYAYKHALENGVNKTRSLFMKRPPL